MRNTLLINMNNNSAVACIDSVASDDNTINLVVYSRSSTDTTTITVYDVEGAAHTYSFTGDVIYYFTIPEEFYSYGQQSIYLVFSDSNYTSGRLQLFFIGREDATAGQMYITKFADVDYYTVYYKTAYTNAEVVQQIEENSEAIAATNEQVQNISNTVAQSATLNEALIESLTTNLTKYALKPRVTHRTDGWEWTDFTTNPDSSVTYTPCFSTSTTDTLRNYINIEDVKIKYLTEELTTPSDYSKIPESDTTYLTINGKQIYYTDLSTLNAFTTISPRNFDSTITAHVEDMYKCRKLTAASSAEWNIEVYQTVSTPTAEQTGLQKNVGIRFNNLADLNYQNGVTTLTLKDSNNVTRGFKVDEKATYYCNDGVNWIRLDNGNANVKIIDHAPTVDDLTGKFTVFAQYDPTSTPVVEDVVGALYNATNMYVEEPKTWSVIVTPATASLGLGRTQQFTANVDVTWSISGNISSNTEIDSTGLLTVGNDETAEEITVTATSTLDDEKTGTATVTVNVIQNEEIDDLAELKSWIRQLVGDYYEVDPAGLSDYWVNESANTIANSSQKYFSVGTFGSGSSASLGLGYIVAPASLSNEYLPHDGVTRVDAIQLGSDARIGFISNTDYTGIYMHIHINF